MPERRKRIMLLSEPLDNFYSLSFWQGANRACRRLGYDLVMVTGNLQFDYSTTIGSQSVKNEDRSNLLFHKLDANLADGVLLWGAQLLHGTSVGSLERVLERFNDKPVVSLGPPMKGIHTLMPDNRSGVRDIVQHLVDAHGIRDIACFIADTGLVEPEAAERYQGYLEGLISRGIEHRPELVVSGEEIEARIAELRQKHQYEHASWTTKAYRYLTEDRGMVPGKDFRAIIVRDDVDAVNLMDYLVGRGIRVPEEVAVCGYDDAEGAASAVVPLTTVRQDFAVHAEFSVDLLDRLIMGESVPEHWVFQSNVPIIRESCGCRNRYVRMALDAENGNFDAVGEGADTPSAIMRSRIGETFRSGGDPLEVLTGMISRARADIGEGKPAKASEWLGAVAELSDILSRKQKEHFRDADVRRYRQGNLERAILASYSLNDIFSALADGLPDLGISACRVVTWRDGALPFAPESDLVFSWESNGACEIYAPGDKPVDPRGLQLPAPDGPDSAPSSWVVTMLHFAGRRIGYALFRIAGKDGEQASIVSFQLATALSGSFLVTSLGRKQAELEKALAEIVELSNRDPLTGLHNRRAMRDELAKEKRRLDRYKGEGAPCFTIVFIDLDNFKAYNDSYGHAIGDLALKLFSDMVNALIRSTDITARFGGDEFLIVLTQTDSAGAAIFAGRLLSSLKKREGFQAEISASLGKEIVIPEDKRLGCSIGIAEYHPGGDIDEILRLADEAVYKAKAEGKNRFVIA